MSKRIYYLDWLRVLAVLLLFPFHVSRVFNAGEPFYVKSTHLSVALSYVLAFIGRWHMPLLFFVAGAATSFALAKRTGGQYLGERTKRLLVPLLFGIFFIIPPQTWYGARFNSGYTESFWYYISSGDFLVFNIRDGSDYYGGFGLGQLWFLLWLFVVSLLALPLLLWAKGRGQAAFGRFAHLLSSPPSWLLAAFIILVGEALPDVAGKNPFYFLAFFVLGYATVCDSAFADAALRARWAVLVTGTLLTTWWVATWRFRDALPDPSLGRAGVTYLGMLAAWLMIVAAVGFGRRYLDRPSPALSYLADASYPLYFFHQTFIVVAAFYIVGLPIDGWMQWVLLLVISVVSSFAAYEIARRVPVLHTLVGAKRRTPAQQ